MGRGTLGKPKHGGPMGDVQQDEDQAVPRLDVDPELGAERREPSSKKLSVSARPRSPTAPVIATSAHVQLLGRPVAAGGG